MATGLADAEVNPIAVSLCEAFGATVGRPRLRKLIEIGRYALADELLDDLEGDLEGLDDLETQATAFRESI